MDYIKLYKASDENEAHFIKGLMEKYSIDVNLLGEGLSIACLLYTSPSPRDGLLSRMPSSA